VFKNAKYGNRVHFYPVKLRYKGEFYQYYILQVEKKYSTIVNYEQSEFAVFEGMYPPKFIRPFVNKIISREAFEIFNAEVNDNGKTKLLPTKVCFDQYVDFVFPQLRQMHLIVSETFKNNVEEAEITGRVFKEVPIEFEVLQD
jgi:hypothetical protein